MFWGKGGSPQFLACREKMGWEGELLFQGGESRKRWGEFFGIFPEVGDTTVLGGGVGLALIVFCNQTFDIFFRLITSTKIDEGALSLNYCFGVDGNKISGI